MMKLQLIRELLIWTPKDFPKYLIRSLREKQSTKKHYNLSKLERVPPYIDTQAAASFDPHRLDLTLPYMANLYCNLYSRTNIIGYEIEKLTETTRKVNQNISSIKEAFLLKYFEICRVKFFKKYRKNRSSLMKKNCNCQISSFPS